MIRHHASRLAVLLLTAGALALTGCAGVADPTRYYVLSPTPAAPGDAARTAVSSAGIGVGPVQIPRYLDRVQIVTRGANDEVEISMYDRWAEPLESGIAQVLADNLAALVGSERIAVFPWRGGVARVLDYQVVVVVLRFDGSRGRQVTLDARWRLLSKDGKELLLKRSTTHEPVTGEGYQPLVLGMNRALVTLAREIAAEIRSYADRRASGS
jgi:uncharacterized lipoprotein YmbA